MPRPVAYIRQSLTDKASSSPERQRETIDQFATRREWVIIEYYVDVGGKRSDIDNSVTRANFQKMMADARAKKFDTIVVSSQERCGTPDIYSFYGLMGELRNLGIAVWDATAGICINPPGYQIGGVFQAFAGTMADTTGQQERAKNVVSGQITKSRQGRYLGGSIAYGCSLKCIGSAGEIIWRCEVVGQKLYETIYADGRQTIKPYTPCGDKASTDRVVFDRSKYTDRAKAVQHCYQRFLEGAGFSTIAGELNNMGYRLPGDRLFYSSVPRGWIKLGIIYTGSSSYFKVARGKFYGCKDGMPQTVDNIHGLSRITHDMDNWITSEQLFEPIIPLETFRLAYKLLVSKQRPRVRQNNTAVYAGLLWCENCGTRMTADGDNKYRCTTYNSKGGTKSGCKPNFIRASVIDERVNDWLNTVGITLNWTGETAPVQALYQIGEINDRALRLKHIIEIYLADKLAQVFEFTVNRDGSKNFDVNGHKFRLPGYKGCPQGLQDLLGCVEAGVNAGINEKVKVWQARKQHLLSIFPEAENKDLRSSIVKEINSLDSQIHCVTTGKTDYDNQSRSLLKQLQSVWLSSKRARSLMEPRAKRAALAAVIERIDCKFKTVTRGTRMLSLINTITIVPVLVGGAELQGLGCRRR